MNTDTLDLPPIVAPEHKHQPEPVLTPIAAFVQQQRADLAELAKVDLKAVALAQFGNWRGDVAAARKTLDGVVHDVSTAAKLADVVALRNRLIRTPRAEVRKVSKAVKSRLAAVSKDVGAEEDAAVAAYDEAEALITPQIDAGQQKLDEERLERERLAAEREAKIKAELAEISMFLDRAQTTDGMTAERVGKGIAILAAMTFGPDDWTDPVAAAKVQLQTIAGMHELQAKLAAEEAAAAQMEALRLANERMAKLLADQQAALDAQAATLRAEQDRIAGLKARIAEIHAAATGHDNATAADLYEAMVSVTALDVSETQYQEFTPLAEAAQDATLAKLQDLHFKAVEREEAAALAATRAIVTEPPAPLAQDECRGLSLALSADPSAPLHVREAAAAIESTEGQAAQQVLKAEPATADATDRDAPADTSPRAGAMGAGQAAGAAPAGGFVVVVPAESTVYAQLSAPAAVEPGVTLIRGEVGTIDAGITIVEPPAMTHAAFLALVMSAFECKFPSHPKPSQEWWAKVRAAGQALQAQA